MKPIEMTMKVIFLIHYKDNDVTVKTQRRKRTCENKIANKDSEEYEYKGEKKNKNLFLDIFAVFCNEIVLRLVLFDFAW